jgi:hypothetical protein
LLGETFHRRGRNSFDLDHFRPARHARDNANASPRDRQAIGEERNQRVIRGTVHGWSMKPHAQHAIEHTRNLVPRRPWL